MTKFSNYISSQFQNPHGFFGKIICQIQNKVNRAMYEKVVSIVAIEEGEKLLDIGYGNGHLLQMLDRKRPLDLYGVDISDDAKEMATKRNRKADKRGMLHLQVGDCCNLSFEDDMFSAVTSINTIYFWEDPVKGLEEIRRVLKPGKSFCNVVYTREYLDTVKYTKIGYKKYDPSQLKEFGEKAGFEKIEVVDIKKGTSYGMVYTK